MDPIRDEVGGHVLHPEFLEKRNELDMLNVLASPSKNNIDKNRKTDRGRHPKKNKKIIMKQDIETRAQKKNCPIVL